MYIIVLSLDFLTVNKLSTEKYFIVWIAKLSHHKGILISKFKSKDMLFWKRGSSFVFTDENLGLLLDQCGFIDHALLQGCCEHPQKILHSTAV